MSGLLSQAMDALRAAAPDGFFVGGCVRDWLLGRPLKDLDVAVPDHVDQRGYAVATALGGVFFWLRKEMEVGRVVVRGAAPLQIDLVPLAGSLEEDLRRRDFTLNAMAVAAGEGLVPGASVIDPTGGQKDLAARRLRLAAPDALERDPLRCLRAFRLRATLGLSFAADLETAIRAAAPGLRRISGERIRDELFVLLEGDQSAAVMADLLAHDLVAPWSLPLAASATGDRGDGGAGVTVVRELDRWLLDQAPRLPCAADLATTLEAQVTPPRSRRALARLAALAIGAGPETRAIAGALCLSADETRILTRAVAGAEALEEAWPVSGRDRLRFSQRWEPGAVEAVLLAVAAAQSQGSGVRGEGSGDEADPSGLLTPDPSPLAPVLSTLLERRLRPASPLLTGNEIMEIAKLKPGPEVGRILQEAEEARADGLLHTAEEARVWLRRREP